MTLLNFFKFCFDLSLRLFVSTFCFCSGGKTTLVVCSNYSLFAILCVDVGLADVECSRWQATVPQQVTVIADAQGKMEFEG